MKVKIVVLLLFLFGVLGLYSFSVSEKNAPNYIPKEGFVPDKETAIKIAEAIWLPIYGEKVLDKKPFHARLKNDSIWVVDGTLPEGYLGGVPHAEINKYSCEVLYVIHGK